MLVRTPAAAFAVLRYAPQKERRERERLRKREREREREREINI